MAGLGRAVVLYLFFTRGLAPGLVGSGKCPLSLARRGRLLSRTPRPRTPGAWAPLPRSALAFSRAPRSLARRLAQVHSDWVHAEFKRMSESWDQNNPDHRGSRTRRYRKNGFDSFLYQLLGACSTQVVKLVLHFGIEVMRARVLIHFQKLVDARELRRRGGRPASSSGSQCTLARVAASNGLSGHRGSDGAGRG